MKESACVWCSAKVEVADDFCQWTQDVVCSKGCKDAYTLFEMMFSDEMMNRRKHYETLTQGEDCD